MEWTIPNFLLYVRCFRFLEGEVLLQGKRPPTFFLFFFILSTDPDKYKDDDGDDGNDCNDGGEVEGSTGGKAGIIAANIEGDSVCKH